MSAHRQHHTPAPPAAPLRELAMGIALAVAIGVLLAHLLTRWH